MVDDADGGAFTQLVPAPVLLGIGPAVVTFLVDEGGAQREGAGGFEQAGEVLAPCLDVLDEDGQQRLGDACAVDHPLVDGPPALAEALQITRPDRTGGNPLGPFLRLGDRPAVEIDIEAPDRQKDRRDIRPRFGLLPGPVAELGPQLVIDLLAQGQVLLARIDAFDGHPEVQDEHAGQLVGGAVVGACPG